MDKINLRTRFIVLFIGIILTSLTMYSLWSWYSQQKKALGEMHEKAYVLSQQLDAVWEFMSINQDRINYDANGEYNFKGLHCSLVGKSIGKLFGRKTNYTIRYVNNNPRNKDDAPDPFENSALEKFRQDRSVKEIYSVSDYNSKPHFRYVVPMNIVSACLDCHGEPVGELDVLGYPKEGWQVGDLGGALSIVMPIDIYVENKKSYMIQEIAFFCMLIFMLILIIYYAMSILVTRPLGQFKLVIEDLKKGNLNTDLNSHGINAKGEIRDLAIHFDSMIVELRNLYKNLESTVELRTIDLADANNILESQQAQLEEINSRLLKDNEYKSDFLAIMSHELRTPLTSIVAFAEVLEKSAITKPLNEKEQRVIHEIKINSQVLLSLINNILDMARLEAGKTEMIVDSVDFVDIVNSVESLVAPLVNKKNINFTAKVDRDVPVIEGDHEKLRRVFENLISNAIKFTPDGGEITAWVDYDASSGQLFINVKDSGIGIDKGNLKLIFDKFVQGDSSIHRPYSGSGLGLALVRELVELHGGSISVQSEINKGSLFKVTIPVKISKEHTG